MIPSSPRRGTFIKNIDMKVAIDTAPLQENSAHHIRGSGFYLRHLIDAISESDTVTLLPFVSQKEIPSDADLVHFPYFEPFFLTLPHMRSYKTVVTVHDLTPIVFSKHFPVGIKGALKWQVQKYALSSVEAIITDSHSSKNDIVRITGVNPDKVFVIPLAAAGHFKKLPMNSAEKDLLRRKYALPDRFVLYVGDVTWNKNLPRLIKAVKKLQVPLLLAGKALTETDFDRDNAWNRDRVEVERLVAASENIRLLGFVPDEDLVALYNLATVFAMPSIYEGFGLPILEAMSCGVPVVAAKAGSLPEVGGDAAMYVDPYNEDEIASAMQKLFSDGRLRESLSKKGIEQAKNFSWRTTAAMTGDVYQHVVKIT